MDVPDAAGTEECYAGHLECLQAHTLTLRVGLSFEGANFTHQGLQRSGATHLRRRTRGPH